MDWWGVYNVVLTVTTRASTWWSTLTNLAITFHCLVIFSSYQYWIEDYPSSNISFKDFFSVIWFYLDNIWISFLPPHHHSNVLFFWVGRKCVDFSSLQHLKKKYFSFFIDVHFFIHSHTTPIVTGKQLIQILSR